MQTHSPTSSRRRFRIPASLGVLIIIQILSLAFSASILGLTSSLISWTNSFRNESTFSRAHLINATVNLALQPTGFRRVGMWLLFAAGLGGTIDAILILCLGFWYQRRTTKYDKMMISHEMQKQGFASSFDPTTHTSYLPSGTRSSTNSDDTLVSVSQHKKSRKTLRIVLYIMVFISVIATLRSIVAVVIVWIEYYRSPRRISGSVIAVPFGDAFGLNLYQIVSSQYTPETWVCGLARVTRGPTSESLGGLCRQATAARVLTLPLVLLDVVGVVTVFWMLF